MAFPPVYVKGAVQDPHVHTHIGVQNILSRGGCVSFETISNGMDEREGGSQETL